MTQTVSDFDNVLFDWVKGNNLLSRQEKLNLLEDQLFCVQAQKGAADPLSLQIAAQRQTEECMKEVWDPEVLKCVASQLTSAVDTLSCGELLEDYCTFRTTLDGKDRTLAEHESAVAQFCAENEAMFHSVELLSSSDEPHIRANSEIKVFLAASKVEDMLLPPPVGTFVTLYLDEEKEEACFSLLSMFYFNVVTRRVERVERTVQPVATCDNRQVMMDCFAFRPLLEL